MKNKRVKQMLMNVLFENKFDRRFHSICEFDMPILTCRNVELDIEQFSSLSGKTISLTGAQLKGNE